MHAIAGCLGAVVLALVVVGEQAVADLSLPQVKGRTAMRSVVPRKLGAVGDDRVRQQRGVGHHLDAAAESVPFKIRLCGVRIADDAVRHRAALRVDQDAAAVFVHSVRQRYAADGRGGGIEHDDAPLVVAVKDHVLWPPCLSAKAYVAVEDQRGRRNIGAGGDDDPLAVEGVGQCVLDGPRRRVLRIIRRRRALV